MFIDKKKKQKEEQFSIANMNLVGTDDDTTCGITDMNCVENNEEALQELDINKMNLESEDDGTCSITNMNCEGDEEEGLLDAKI